MRTWTARQSDAISAREGTVLVSAAAGSGKTSVLVERLIQRITDEKKPSSADRLLVVTFTKAAAKEMKERVEKSVSDLVRQDPTNKMLQKQQMLIPSMNVSTVHSFCSKLCREYFYLLDIAPDYKIISDQQQQEMMNEAVKDAVANCFESGSFILADDFSSEKNDITLFETVIKLYKFTNSHFNPNEWLDETVKKYDGEFNIEETQWGKIIKQHLIESIKSYINLSKDNLKTLEFDVDLYKAYGDAISSDIKMFSQIMETAENEGWDDIRKAFSDVKWATLGRIKGFDDVKENSKNIRNKIKESFKKIENLFKDDEETCKLYLTKIKPVAKALVELTKDFSSKYSELKKEKKFVDYGDLEQMTIKLLLENKDGKIVQSQIARDLSNRFDEIMIDEYQDTNEVQDWIFRAISKNDNNKFMVGDLKQCIYSFRQAMPDIFINYKDSFTKYDRENSEYPATIVLDQNFRSRKNVIDSVNFIFHTLMSKEAGGVDYVGDEALSQGAIYEDGDGYDTQLDFLEKSKSETVEITEARHIAQTINEIIKSGLLVGNERKNVTYKDFAILLRNANKHSQAYALELEKNGVPAKAQVARPFFSASEVLQVLSFLQIIDNPNQDIPLLSVLLGPVYGFTPSEIAEFRVKDKKSSVYVSLVQDDSGKFDVFLQDMQEYRLMATHLPSHIFIDHLFNKTSLLELVGTMEGGEGRIANLRLLRQYASDYEGAGYRGVSGFVSFMDKLFKNKSNIEGASLTSEASNSVKIMSIHKSKGLEFPVCIVAGCGKGKKPETSNVLMSSKHGIGLKVKNEITGVKYDNFVRNSLVISNKMDEMSEELRILYVAATRAREKLIFISTLEKVESVAMSLASMTSSEKNIEAYTVKSMPNTASWLMLCALKHPNGSALRHRIGIDDTIVNYDDFTPWNIRIIPNQTKETVEVSEEDTEQAVVDISLYNEMKNKLDFVYDNQEFHKIPVKVTASAIVKMKSGKVETLPRPSFMSYKGLTPAERGIAMHSFVELCDFKKAAINPQDEAKRLVEHGYLTKEQGEAINFSKVKAFFKSEIGTRIVNSDEFYRELRFSAKISANLVDENFPKDKDVILQGSVDCAFMENDKLYIVDFKTDRVDDLTHLVETYGVQLKLYADALEKVKDCKIGGCYLYSFHANESIEVE